MLLTACKGHSRLSTAEASRPELGFTAAAAAHYFPTYQAFIEEFAYGLEHADELQTMEMGHRFVQPLLQVRDVADPALVAAPLAALPPALFDRLLTDLLAFITPQSDTYAVHGTLHLLNLLRHYAPWQAAMQTHLEAQRGGYYDYEVQQLLAGNLEVKLPAPESPPPAEPPVTPLADELPPTTPIAYSPFAFPGPLGELLLFTLAELQPETSLLPELPTANSALRALYATGRYQTPAALQRELTRHQVALWRGAGEQLWALSSRTATVLLPVYQGGEKPLDFVTFLPAKGGGYLALYAGQMAFYDAYQSPVLKQLLAEVLARTAANVNYLQSHDC